MLSIELSITQQDLKTHKNLWYQLVWGTTLKLTAPLRKVLILISTPHPNFFSFYIYIAQQQQNNYTVKAFIIIIIIVVVFLQHSCLKNWLTDWKLIQRIEANVRLHFLKWYKIIYVPYRLSTVKIIVLYI